MASGTDPDEWAQQLTFTPMTVESAHVIADTWKYPAPYDFYDTTADRDDYEEFISPDQWPSHFWQVHHGGDLVGFFTAEPSGDETVQEISLGLHPDLTGGGRGLAFLRSGLAHVAAATGVVRIRLSVAAFNQRAIRVYKQPASPPSAPTYSQPTAAPTSSSRWNAEAEDDHAHMPRPAKCVTGLICRIARVTS